MRRSPFKIMRPFVVSLSGGRTSAYMLWCILQEYNGLPNDAFVLFANTGKERDETLDFVRDIGDKWNVKITWLENEMRDGISTFKKVCYYSAHRRAASGSPFEKLIDRMPVLPNPTARNCTNQLKIVPMREFLKSKGWDRDFHRQEAIGIRFDEAHRAIQIRADKPDYCNVVFPLVDAKITERDIMDFWSKQSFDLRLQPHESNCDLCFLKSKAKIVDIIKKNPRFADWWIEMEKKKFGVEDRNKFRNDRTFRALAYAATESTLFDDDEISFACMTGVVDFVDSDGD